MKWKTTGKWVQYFCKNSLYHILRDIGKTPHPTFNFQTEVNTNKLSWLTNLFKLSQEEMIDLFHDGQNIQK